MLKIEEIKSAFNAGLEFHYHTMVLVYHCDKPQLSNDLSIIFDKGFLCGVRDYNIYMYHIMVTR